MPYEWSYAPTNRAMCKGACKTKIDKGAIRLAVHSIIAGNENTQFRCLDCVTLKQIENIKSENGSLEEVPGFHVLSEDDQALVRAKDPDAVAAPKAPPTRGRAKPKAKAAAAAPARPPAVDVQHKFLDKAKDYDFPAVKAMLEEHPGLLNVQPAGRWSALHQFASNGDTDAVEHLLGLGADRNVKTKDGKTPLEVAKDSCKEMLEEPPPEPEPEEAAPTPSSSSRAAPPAKAAVPKRKAPEPAKAPEPVKAPAAPAPKAAAASSGEPPAKKAKMGRPVDGTVPNRSDYSVVDDWSVTLNQTNVVANNNKYYKIQLLKSSDGKFFLWTHWGRVGSSGQSNLQPYALGKDYAENEFKSKFKQKSGVHYDMLHAHDWTPVVGKYTLVDTDEQEGAEGGGSAPLGKLTPQQIEKGQAVLEKISTSLSTGDVHSLPLLSGEYYTLVPHDFGFMVPPNINTKDKLEAEEELLKFYLRMGFEEMDKADDGLTPIAGIMDMALPPSLELAASKICSTTAIKASVAKGTAHATKQSGKPSKAMEAHLYGAIMLYTSNAIYRALNNALRSEDRTKIKKYFSYLRLFLEALGRLPQQKRTLWRGVGVDLYDEYQVGKTITWWGVSSCTSELSVAKGFMKGCGGKCTLLTVETKTAADISDITFFGNEKENLLAPGTQLKVLSSKREGNITEIKLQEVGRVLA